MVQLAKVSGWFVGWLSDVLVMRGNRLEEDCSSSPYGGLYGVSDVVVVCWLTCGCLGLWPASEHLSLCSSSTPSTAAAELTTKHTTLILPTSYILAEIQSSSMLVSHQIFSLIVILIYQLPKTIRKFTRICFSS